MSNLLTLVLFSYESKISILKYLPSFEDLEKYCNDNEDLHLKIVVFDQEATPYDGKNVSIKNKPIYDWNETYSPTGTYSFKGIYSKELNDTLLFDNSEGEVIFSCFSEERLDTYTIMEDLETQKYEKRYYYSHIISEDFKLSRIIKRWKKERKEVVESPFSEEVKSPKNISAVPENKYSYELYSGGKIPEELSEIDKVAVKARMILLAETIKFWLSVSFDKKASTEEMNKLEEVGKPYTKDPFFSDEEVKLMVRNSYYFQVEDPLLKGFLLAHPLRVVSEKKSQFGEETSSSINPLDIERDISWLMFNHGQFRQVLLSTVMQVVSTFAANNGFLFQEDIGVTPSVKKKKSTKKEKKTVITEKKGSVTSKSMLRPIEIEEEEEEVEPGAIVNNIYRSSKLWDKIIRRIVRQINE